MVIIQNGLRMGGMEDLYLRNAKIVSALSIPIRLQILDLLSCGKLCVAEIQDVFSYTTNVVLSYENIG